MDENAEGTEQTPESSNTEGVKSVKDAIAKATADGILNQPAGAEPGEGEEEKSSEEKTPQGEEEGGEENPPKAKPKLFILDEQGNKTPLVFKADGKEYAPEDVEKALTWSSLGVHANEKLEDANKKLAEYNAAQQLISRLQTAMKEGRLVIDGKPVSQKAPGDDEEEEDDDEEDEYTDPEILKMRKMLKEQRKELGNLKDYQFKKMINEKKAELDSAIAKAKESHFAALVEGAEEGPVGVWKLLAETNQDGSPKYTPEQAAEASHKSILSFVSGFIKSHPEALDADTIKEVVKARKDIIDKDEIYLQVLKEKGTHAPVSGPSHMEAGTEKKEKGKITGVKDALRRFQEDIAASRAAGRKL